MKPFCLPSPRVLCFALAFFLGGAAVSSKGGEVNPYDALGAVLQPLASAFSSRSEFRGIALELELEDVTGVPPELIGKRVEMLVQPPDSFLVRVRTEGESWALGRVGQELWFTPGSKLTGVVPLPEKPKKKGAPGIDAMTLPFTPAQLALLPALFTVKEGAPSEAGRVLYVRLMPELARSLGVEEWSARLLLRREDGRLGVLELARPGWRVRVKVARLEVVRSLPPESWFPLPEEEADVVRISGADARRWLEKWERVWKGR